MMVNNGSEFIIGPAEDFPNSTPAPEPSKPSPRCTDMTEKEASTPPWCMIAPDKKTEPTITPVPKLHSESDQVRELATSVGVEYEGMDEDPTTEGELLLIYWKKICYYFSPSPLVPSRRNKSVLIQLKVSRFSSSHPTSLSSLLLQNQPVPQPRLCWVPYSPSTPPPTPLDCAHLVSGLPVSSTAQ